MFLNCGIREDSWESLGLQGDPTSQSYRKLVLNIYWEDWYWSWNSNTLAPDVKNWLIWKDPDDGKDWRQEEKGMTEDEMVGWHHWLNGHEFEQALGVGDGQGSLACCRPWGHKELDTTEQLNWTELTATWIDLDIIMLSKVSQAKTNVIWYHVYDESTKDTKEHIYKTEIERNVRNRLTDIENKLMVTKGEGRQRGKLGVRD